MTGKVALREVGMRDGLQSLSPILTTEQKNAWCAAEFAAGVKEIEVTSFVPAKLLPMFADAEEVVRHALALEGLTVSALIPNLRGAERGVALGVHELAHEVRRMVEGFMPGIPFHGDLPKAGIPKNYVPRLGAAA